MFGTKPWLFIFYNSTTTNEKYVRDAIEEEFLVFKSIAYNSRVYVQVVTNERLFLFEVYKVTQNSTLTISMMCQMNLVTLNVDKLDKRNIWQRRKNLSDVNLRVGIMVNHALIYKGPKVIFTGLAKGDYPTYIFFDLLLFYVRYPVRTAQLVAR